MKISVPIDGTYDKGRVSLFFIGLSFCFVPCRKLMFVNNYEKSQKMPVFGHNIKTMH